MKKDAKNNASSEQSCEFGPGAVVVRDTAQGRLIAVGDLPPVTLRRMVEKARVEVVAP
jgi:negative regulator of sigma E activity